MRESSGNLYDYPKKFNELNQEVQAPSKLVYFITQVTILR